MSKKISITWSKAPPKEVAGKLEYYEIDLHQSYGLLSDPDRQDYAQVKTHFSYSIVKNGKFFPETQTRTRTVYGPPNEVYDYHMKNANASKEMFVRAWQVAKDRDLSSLTVFPYKPAYVNEKISEEINKTYYGGAKEFAEKAGKDYSNVFKELKGTRKISLQQAIEYAEVLKCDPVDLLFEKLRTKVWASVNFLNRIGTSTGYNYQAGQLKFYDEDKFTTVPRHIWRPDIRCVTVRSEGSFLDRQHLFYYKSKDKQPPNCHGKLCMVGVDIIIDGIADFREYFVGIYEQALGGKVNLANPDPFSKHRYIAKDIENIFAVAPIVAVVNPLLLDDRDRKEQLENFPKLQELLHKESVKQMKEQARMVNKFDQIEELQARQKELEARMREEIKLMERNIELEYKARKKRA